MTLHAVEESASRTDEVEKATLRLVGKRIPRRDAFEKVTGEARFTFDLMLPDMQYGKIKRSTYAHAKILSVDTSKAEQFPGVKAVVTAADVPPDARFGSGLYDETAFARDVVRYVGEPVAAVAAETEAIAEEALDLIEIKYEPLPAVFDAEEAMQTNPKVVIHPDLRKYRFPKVLAPKLVPDRPNIGNYFKIRTGDVEKGFKESDIIVENKYSTAPVHHGYMETMVAVAKPELDGSVTLWTSSQAVPIAKQLVCDALGLPPDRIRVIVPYVGGGFGAKTAVKVEPACVLLALKAKKPVRIALTREEDIAATSCRFPFKMRVKDGVKKDGTLMAREVLLVLNMGGYSEQAYLEVRNCAYGAVGTYKIPNFKLDSYGVYTNQLKAGPLRGFGSPEVSFAIESQMDELAEKLGMDPVEFRLKNLLHEGDANVIGEKMVSVGSEECLEKVAKAIGWGQAPERPSDGPWRRGKGVAVSNKYSAAPTASSAVVRLLPDNTVEVRFQATEIGQGSHMVLAQIAAEELKVPLEKVRITACDTLTTPFGAGAWSSRQTYNEGNAVRLACKEAKKELLRVAAKKFNVPPESLEFENGELHVRGTTQVMDLGELYTDHIWNIKFLEDVGEITGRATSYQRTVPMDENGHSPRSCSFYMHNAHAVEVEVNVETGQTRVLKYASAADCGKAVNPINVEQQIEGGISMGIGMTLFEELVMKDGRVINSDYLDYKLPTSLDHPAVDNMISIVVEAAHPEGPYGAKGVGEVTLVAASPAIANAIYNAVGLRVRDLPLNSEKIFKGLRAESRGR